MGAIAETKGKESLWRDAAAGVGLLAKLMARSGTVGAVADGGILPIGPGISEKGGKATREGQTKTEQLANKLIESEEQAIQHVRNTYGIELRPW